MNRAGVDPEPPPTGLIGNIAEFGNDVATLSELQAKLALYDTKECLGRATVPIIALAGGVAVALGSLPIVLFGIAEVVVLFVPTLNHGVALLIVGLVALGLAGVAAFVGWKALLGSLTSFRRSQEELTRNLSWIKTVLVHSGRTIARRRV